jgi:hypothetical protein
LPDAVGEHLRQHDAVKSMLTIPRNAHSDEGGRRAAAIYTLINTMLCRMRHSAVYADCRTMPNGLVFPEIHRERRVIGSA